MKQNGLKWNRLKGSEIHIEFIRIHPFEDGNGRTSRLLLNFNLLKQRLALVITEDLAEYYHTYIRDNDVEGMANLLEFSLQREYNHERIV